MARFEANINPLLLKWARARLRMPLEIAAKKIKVEADLLSAWERGDERPSFSVLRRVARSYGKPLSFFYLPEPPADFKIPADFRVLPGTQGADDSDVMSTIFDALQRRSVIVDIYEDSKWSFPDFDVELTTEVPTSEAASRIRRHLGVSVSQQKKAQGAYASLSLWRNSIESSGVLVFQYGVSIDLLRGLSLFDSPFPIVVISAKDAPNARVFSLLHEFVHLALREGGICTCSEFGHENITESYCDAVAAETLVPAASLEIALGGASAGEISAWNDRQFAHLAKTFGVSEHVVLRRIYDMKMISPPVYWRRVKELSERRFYARSTGGTHYRNRVAQLGRPYINTVLVAHDRGVISTRDAASYLRTSYDGFEKLRKEAA